MVSVKQVEAFVQSAQLGSFVSAAERLNTTQSNISKRIQELEYILGSELFDRGNRTIRLTAKGQELLAIGEELLSAHMRLRQIGNSTILWRGPFRFGVTEAIALTWLPLFSALLQREFPGLVPIATTDASFSLNQLLMDRKIDFVIATERNLDSSFVTKRLFEAERVWVASPRLIQHDELLTARDISKLPMLGHADITHNRNVFSRYLQSQGIEPNIVTSCTSISALARMAIDGIGITYLHRDVFAPEIESGKLKVLNCELKIPAITYVAAYRSDSINPVLPLVASHAVDLCSTGPFHAKPADAV